MTVLRWALRLSLICCLGAALTPAFAYDTTVRVSLSSAGAEGDANSSNSSISADGRYVAFLSLATNLVEGDTNGVMDVFVRDRVLGTTERVSVSSAGAQADAENERPSISADGRYVAFDSDATNLVEGDSNKCPDVFVRDRLLGTTERVSVSSAQVGGNWGSCGPSISADGRYVAFFSFASNLAGGDTNVMLDVFVRDRLFGTTERVSVSSAGAEGDADSLFSSISADGRYVAFESDATNLVEGDSNGKRDVFVRDRDAGETERVSVSSAEAEGNGVNGLPSISANGSYVAFMSDATNLVEGDKNGWYDIFVRDRLAGTTERVSVSSAEAEGNDESLYPSISADGRYAAFCSRATNLVEGDSNLAWDVCVRDRDAGTTERVSLTSAGAEGDDGSYRPSISADGRHVAFYSAATNLVGGDSNGVWDVFVRAPASIPHVLLEVHPNERAPGTNTGQSIGVAPWTRPSPTQPSMYWWEHYRFVGSDALWIQVCAQNWNATQNGTGDDDNIRLRIDGFVPVDYDLIQNGPWGAYQWKGSKENGHRWTLRFLYLGPSPLPLLHAVQFEADETPVIWWIKVTDLQEQMIYLEL